MPTDPDASLDDATRSARNMVADLSQQLDNRISAIQQWQDYYDGTQPLRFATDEYRKHFGSQYAGFKDNWCAPVVDTTAEKLTVAGLRLAEAGSDAEGDGLGGNIARTADREFANIWAANEGAAQSSQAFTEACIAKRAFALVWGGDDGIPDITFESADEVIVGYEPGARRKRKAALKRWTDGTNDYATLYTASQIWKWQRVRPQGSPESYTPDELRRYQWIIRTMPSGQPAVITNPAGVVPIIELANRPRLKSPPLSDVEGAAAMQDAINALWAYLFTAADFAAMPQRVVLGALAPKMPVLDKDGKQTGAFKQVPINEFLAPAQIARMMAFEGDNAKIAQWDPAKLDVFTNTIEFAVGHLAAQSRTPAHYFTGKISNIPADGLVALAQAHIAKVRERSVYHSIAIKEIASTAYLMLDRPAKALAARQGRVMWNDFEIRAEGQMADLAIKLRQADFSFEYVAEKFISDPVELAEEIDRYHAAQAAKAAMLEFGPKPDPTGGPETGGPDVEDAAQGDVGAGQD